jgi:hypothetical protein
MSRSEDLLKMFEAAAEDLGLLDRYKRDPEEILSKIEKQVGTEPKEIQKKLKRIDKMVSSIYDDEDKVEKTKLTKQVWDVFNNTLDVGGSDDPKVAALIDLAERRDSDADTLRLILFYDPEKLAAFATRNGSRDAMLDTGRNINEYERQLTKHMEFYYKIFESAEKIAKGDEHNIVSDLVLDRLRDVYRLIDRNLDIVKKEVKTRMKDVSNESEIYQTFNNITADLDKTIHKDVHGHIGLPTPNHFQFLQAIKRNQIL